MRGLNRSIVALLALLLILCIAVPEMADAAMLRQGSSGEQVKMLQSKLKRWGYYNGNVDGIFGSGTAQAVKYFQKKNGLTADGIVGEATAKALGLSLTGSSGGGSSGSGGSSNSGDKDLYLLAKLVHGESRGEPYKGKVAVAAVVLNRVKSSSFPNSISGVIYQKGAFSAVSDGQINLSPDNESIKAARDAMNGWDPTGGCLYYYNPKKTSNKWRRARLLLMGHNGFIRGEINERKNAERFSEIHNTRHTGSGAHRSHTMGGAAEGAG